jgi:hypothetical protein
MVSRRMIRVIKRDERLRREEAVAPEEKTASAETVRDALPAIPTVASWVREFQEKKLQSEQTLRAMFRKPTPNTN